jgi:hypothetical protein
MGRPDPVDDYYKPLTREERDIAVQGEFPPYGEMLGWVRRWEATVRALEARVPPSTVSTEGWHRPYCDAPDGSDLNHPDCICGK